MGRQLKVEEFKRKLELQPRSLLAVSPLLYVSGNKLDFVLIDVVKNQKPV